MKMVMLAYNEAIETEVMEVLANCGLQNYTKISGVYGRGSASGIHLGNDIWPGRNNVLLVAGDEHAAKHLLSSIKELRQKLGREGVKAFSWDLSEMT